jgi:hypothetical protein
MTGRHGNAVKSDVSGAGRFPSTVEQLSTRSPHLDAPRLAVLASMSAPLLSKEANTTVSTSIAMKHTKKRFAA